jgi:hypothetical protein
MKNISDRNRLIHLTIILLSGILACWYTYEEKVELLGDNANYYILGKALAQGDGYTLISHPQKPQNNHYPPGYPAVMVPVLWLSGDSIQAVKILNCLMFLGSILILYNLSSKWLSPVLAFIISLFCILNSHLLFYSSIMMSEIPYLFFSLLTIWFFTKINSRFRWGDKYLYLSLAALVITYYIRALGVALFLGMIIHLLVNRQWKQTVFYAAGLFILVFPWYIRSAGLGGSSYMNQLKMLNPYQPSLGLAQTSDFIARIGENLQRYVTKEIPSAFYPAIDAAYQQPADMGDWIFGFVLIILGLAGCWFIKPYRFLLLGYLLATFGILMLWPQVWYGVRFIIPIIPVFYLAIAATLAHLLYDKLNQPRQEWKPYLLLVFVFPLLGPVNKLHDDAGSPYHPAWNSYFKAAEWINKNSPEGSVISAGKPSLFYLYAGRPTMRYLFSKDEEELLSNLAENGVDYVIVDQVYGNTIRYLLPVVQSNRDKFELVHQIKNPDTFVLKLKK